MGEKYQDTYPAAYLIQWPVREIGLEYGTKQKNGCRYKKNTHVVFPKITDALEYHDFNSHEDHGDEETECCYFT